MTTEFFTRLIVNKLKELNEEVVLNNPKSNSKFPCIVVSTPLKSVLATENQKELRARFQVSVEVWSDKHYTNIELMDKITSKLLEFNMVETNVIPSSLDEVIQKYRMIATYEARYNALYNSFEIIR